MTVRSRNHGRRRFFYFICASYDHRGTAVRSNGLLLPMAAADDAILTKVSDVVLAREIVEGAIADAIRELRPARETLEAKRQALQAELKGLEEQQRRYVAAIAVADHVEVLARALQDKEQQRARLQQ